MHQLSAVAERLKAVQPETANMWNTERLQQQEAETKVPNGGNEALEPKVTTMTEEICRFQMYLEFMTPPNQPVETGVTRLMREINYAFHMEANAQQGFAEVDASAVNPLRQFKFRLTMGKTETMN